MDALRMLLAVILIFCAAAVAAQFILSPLYANLGNAALVVWYYLDILMALSLVIALAVQLQRKRLSDRNRGDGLSREKLEANVMFFAVLLAALWFFRNWFDFLASTPLGDQSVAAMVVWELVDPLIVIVLGLTGCRLWRGSLPASGYTGPGRN